MPHSVLVLEDEETVAFTLREVLAADGYEVEEASSTAEALRQIATRHFDVALLDLRVGEDSGLTVLSRLQETASDTVALILTGYGSLDTAVEAMRRGASDYLLKPCDVDELKAAIARGLNERSAHPAASPEATSRELGHALDQALHARDDFLEVAGHELKTPLSVVIGWAQHAQRRLAQGAGESVSAELDIVVQQARRLARLAEAFTEVIRIQQGGVGLSPEQVDLRALVSQAVDGMRIVHSRHTFQLDMPAEPVPALLDVAGTETIVNNLLENAAKFSPQEEEVVVRLTTSSDEARIAVTDRGVGIPATELANIFQRYYQPNLNVRQRHYGGLGISLYLSRTLAEAHGGKLWAESAGAGQGSTFYVTLPIGQSKQ